MSANCPHCRRPVIWCKTRAGKNIPLDPRVDPLGVYVPLRGRAWEPAELVLKGEPWSDFAAAGAHLVHIATCPLWPRPDPERVRGGAQGHLACHFCGVIDATVRHCADGDRCRDCRLSTVDATHDMPLDVTPVVSP